MAVVIGILAAAVVALACVVAATLRRAGTQSVLDPRAGGQVQRVTEQDRDEFEREQQRARAQLEQLEGRMAERERRLADRESRLDALVARLDERDAHSAEAAAEAERQRRTADEELAALRARERAALERCAAMTAGEARAELVRQQEQQARREAAILVRDIEAQARAEGEKRARSIVTLAVQRVASEQTAESVVSVLHLPSDDMKGRIIGREGRNIRAFEAVTGVNVIIDDTPEAVLLSCFDPVRREVGRVAMESLIRDGRIHPQRIEEAYEAATGEIDKLCLRAAEEALLAVGITEIDDVLAEHLGRLRYRTSYGQNVLKHLVETAHIAGTMAAELHLDVPLVKRCAFLHDIGKALTHEVEGSHAIIGAELARSFGESDEVVHAIEAHHNEVPPHSLEAVLTQASDSCSGGRPGARRENVESYVQRMERIEEIAAGKSGVEKVFAMQAGREIRVMVQPDVVDDIGAHVLAREVAQQIEQELTYPGQIRVTVVRESRASEVAH
ncbi:MAG TPA: ribonuclease Y [Mycobacteriales bacterium]|nr:ribonuclease Y [Mycobacteriales bacterium]